MSKTKFTPGPWEAQGLYIMFTNADTKQFDWVAKVERFADKYKHEEAANAALIAAAPELYEALESIVDVAKNLDEIRWSDIEHIILPALAKARGEKTDEQ